MVSDTLTCTCWLCGDWNISWNDNGYSSIRIRFQIPSESLFQKGHSVKMQTLKKLCPWQKFHLRQLTLRNQQTMNWQTLYENLRNVTVRNVTETVVIRRVQCVNGICRIFLFSGKSWGKSSRLNWKNLLLLGAWWIRHLSSQSYGKNDSVGALLFVFWASREEQDNSAGPESVLVTFFVKRCHPLCQELCCIFPV